MISTFKLSSIQRQFILNITVLFFLIIALVISSSNVASAKGTDTRQKVSPFQSRIFTHSRLLFALEDLRSAQRSLNRLERERRDSQPAQTAPVVVTAPPATTPVTVKPPVTSTPVAQVQSNSTFAKEFELKVIEYTNAERSKQGLKPLTADTTLTKIAQNHSADMLANNYFSHTNKSGCDPRCRIDAANYKWQSYGENIYWMSGFTLTASESARKVVDGWMNSAGHRANILSAKFTKIGVGVDVKDKKLYTTADYALPK